MKKSVLLFLIFSLVSMLAYSQNYHPRKHHLRDSLRFKHHKDSINQHKPPMHDTINPWHPKPPRHDSIYPPKPPCHDSIYPPKPPRHDSIYPPKPPCHDSINKPNTYLKIGDIYPNPVKDLANLNVYAKISDVKITIAVLDRKEQVLSTNVYTLSLGHQTIKVNTENIKKGMYYLRITCVNSKIIKKFLKL